MKIRFQSSFNNQFSKLSNVQKQLVKDALEIFGDNPQQDALRTHPLKAPWNGYYSITADGDLRLHFKVLHDDTALFIAVGTHYELYR